MSAVTVSLSQAAKSNSNWNPNALTTSIEHVSYWCFFFYSNCKFLFALPLSLFHVPSQCLFFPDKSMQWLCIKIEILLNVQENYILSLSPCLILSTVFILSYLNICLVKWISCKFALIRYMPCYFFTRLYIFFSLSISSSFIFFKNDTFAAFTLN